MPSLDVGCGPYAKRGDVGIDRSPGPAVDIVHDLNVFPWPIADATFERVLCTDVLEHLPEIIPVMEEIHRVGTPGAIVQIEVPTASSRYFYTDPTHVRGFGYRSFEYFEPNTEYASRYGYSRVAFAVRRIRFVKEPGSGLRLLDRLMCWFANTYPHLYEARFSYIYPMDGLHFELQVIK
jgi:SAM-dependent methyltransferase